MAPVHPARRAAAPRSPRAIARGLAAVAALFLTAADALVTAALGLPRLAWVARRVATACGDEYRRARWGAVDVTEVIEPGPDREDRTPPEGGTPVAADAEPHS
jgi:hypothetical protein